MLSESAHTVVNIVLGGMMGLLVWLAVELSVEKFKEAVVKGPGPKRLSSPSLDADFWVQNVLQSMNFVIIGVLFGSPIEIRWPYITASFVAGAILCRLVFYLVKERKISVHLHWLFP